MLLSFAGGIFIELASFKSDPPREEPGAKVLRVEVYQTEPARFRHYVSAFGTAEADREVVVSAEVAGQITSAEEWEVGDVVTGNEIVLDADGTSQRVSADVLAKIDPQTYQERVGQVESLLDQDEIRLQRLDQEHATNKRLIEQQKRRLATIQAEFDRLTNLRKQGAASETQVDRVKLELEQYKETQIRLEQEDELYPIRRKEILSQQSAHQNDLRLAKLDLEKATINAPFSGVISDIFVERGQYVRPGEPLVQITDVAHIVIPVPLLIEDAEEVEEQLRTGKYPDAELVRRKQDFGTERHWRGVVRRLDPIVDQQTRTRTAFIELANKDQSEPLQPGAFVYARIRVLEIAEDRGLMIPRHAIVNGKVFVTQKRDDSLVAQRQPVEVLETFQSMALVDGLQSNGEVVMTNLDIMEDGKFLEVTNVNALQSELDRLQVPSLEVIK